MRTSRVAAYVATWVAVVVLGSTVVWAVISRAGEGVVTSDNPSARAPEGSSVPRSPAESASSSRTPTASPSRSPSRTPSASPSPSGSTSPSPDPAPTSSGPSAPPPVARTWSGVGGVIVVVCRGGAAELDGARPDTGFRVEVDDTGPGRVEVEFEGQGDRDAETRVRATCVGGVPTFAVDLR